MPRPEPRHYRVLRICKGKFHLIRTYGDGSPFNDFVIGKYTKRREALLAARLLLGCGPGSITWG